MTSDSQLKGRGFEFYLTQFTYFFQRTEYNASSHSNVAAGQQGTNNS